MLPKMGARELVQRLIVAELLALPGEGPLARRPLHARPKSPSVPPALPPSERAGEPEEPEEPR